jgi:GRAM domain-containing protein 4
VAKALYGGIGTLFWHIIPVIAAIPTEERARLPPPLGNVPTDAEYAMEVISQRVAAGLDVKPRSLGNKMPWDSSASASSLNLAGDLGDSSKKKGNGDVNWNKWANRVAEGKRVVTGTQVSGWYSLRRWSIFLIFFLFLMQWRENVERGLNPVAALLPKPTSTRSLATEQTHSQCPIFPKSLLFINTNKYMTAFPAQHSSGPGLITLTPTTIFFTPIISQRPHVTIALSSLSGVKKSGLLKGLKLCYSEQEGTSEESEVKFPWVGGRDELFARLVAIKKNGWQL